MKKKLGQNIWEFLGPFVDRLEKNLLMRLLKALTPLGILFTIIALSIGVLAFLRESEIRKHNLINLAFARLESAKGIKSDVGQLEALKILCKMQIEFREFDLTEYYFTGLDLPKGTNLEEVRLLDAQLQRSNLSYVKLSGAVLVGTELKDAKLVGTVLKKAYLKNADLSGADLSHADLTEANLEGAILRGAIMIGTDLTNANLSGADLSMAKLENCTLNHAELIETSIIETQFKKCDIIEVNFERAQLEGAIFEQSNLTESMFEDAEITKTKFLKVIGLNQEKQINKACYEEILGPPEFSDEQKLKPPSNSTCKEYGGMF